MMTQPKALKHLKKGLVAALLFCLASTTNIAQAQNPFSQKLVYEVYAGGIHAVQASLDIDVSEKNKYSLVLDAHTRGFLGSLVPWEGVFESHGWANKGKFAPQKHQSTTTWKDEEDIKEYLYNKDGTFKSLRITDEHSKGEKREVKPEVTDGTIDVLTATLRVLENYKQTGKCEGTAEVFDGKRRFEMSFVHVKDVHLKASDYNTYEGPAAECTVEVKPINGEWSKKPRGWLSIQEQGRKKGTIPTVWIAKIAEKGAAVPVKIRVKTDYGTLFMHMAEYKSGKTHLVAENRHD